MDKILAIISILVLLVLMAPAALRMNVARGTTSRNITIWLVIFVALVFLSRYFRYQ